MRNEMKYTYEEALKNIDAIKIGDSIAGDSNDVGEKSRSVALGQAVASLYTDGCVWIVDWKGGDFFLDVSDIQELARAIIQGQARGQVAPGVAER